MQISCVQSIYCDFEMGGDEPIPVSNSSIEFTRYTDFLGAAFSQFRPMQVGDTLAIKCIDKGSFLIHSY